MPSTIDAIEFVQFLKRGDRKAIIDNAMTKVGLDLKQFGLAPESGNLLRLFQQNGTSTATQMPGKGLIGPRNDRDGSPDGERRDHGAIALLGAMQDQQGRPDRTGRKGIATIRFEATTLEINDGVKPTFP